MTEEFKEKLKKYAEGKLSQEEQREIEVEIERLEEYQGYLDELMDDKKEKAEAKPSQYSRKIVSKGKWKARFHNALTALALFIIASIISGIITNSFYGFTNGGRRQTYSHVVNAVYSTTEPSLRFRNAGTHVGSYFSMKINGNFVKRIGMQDYLVGEVEIPFLFSKAGYPQKNMLIRDWEVFQFTYPGTDINPLIDLEWQILEKLPEGTVTEAYISFNRLYEIDEILGEFENLNLHPVWLAVDTGREGKDIERFGPSRPLGFPWQTLWHPDDWKLIERTVERNTVSETRQAPNIESYGSGDLRSENFIQTLKLLDKHKNITSRITWIESLPERIAYVEEHGVKIYGMVVTGPTKEILDLKEMDWLANIRVGESRLWNWRVFE